MLLFGTAPVGLDGLHVDRRAVEVLNLVAPTSLLDIAGEGPLAHAPIVNLALHALIVVAGHLRGAPIWLTGHAAEAPLTRRGEVDAYVVAAAIVYEGSARTVPEVSCECLAR